MSTPRLFILDGPPCAIETGSARQATVCSDCGRGQRIQVRDLHVTLTCRPRRVWLSDGNAVLLEAGVANALLDGLQVAARLRPVSSAWRSGVAWGGEPVPNLVQLVAEQSISASSRSVEPAGCSCGAVRALSFDPLVVHEPETAAGVWSLAQNPAVLVIDENVRVRLATAASDLELLGVWSEGEYTPPEAQPDPIDWSDL